MLLVGIVTFSIAIPLCYNTVNAFHYTRLAVIIFILVCESPREYSLVVIFSVIGGSMILSKLQSFALYIIAALSRDSLRSVQASVNAFILLGVGIIYTSTGSTSLVSMSDWISSTSIGPFSNAGLGLIFIYTPDVYQNTPTVVSIITALFTITNKFINTNVMYALLVVSVSSIVIGAVTGLVQTQLRRLIAFSTINHVGFIVLCLGLGVESSTYESGERPVNYLSDLRQSFSKYSIVTFSIVISLFSIIGLPPIVGFIAKMGAYVNFMVAIMSSVIIKIIMFDGGGSKMIETPHRIRISNISPLHAYTISTGTAFICLFILDSEVLINSIELSLLTI
ncbi:hypothetical protein BY996DRAFT_6434616 [Phakopsora pachyrhizi]|nr:hypothetical protein BY996DRAFT_6434616 [Phakopsora pachyrhizi]